MELSNRYNLKTQVYLPQLNKMWGWFIVSNDSRTTFRPKTAWAWWAHVGKPIHVSHISFSNRSANQLTNSKIKNGYHQITTDTLLELWPNFYEDLNNRMIFELLSR